MTDPDRPRRVVVVDDSPLQCAIWRRLFETRYGNRAAVETFTDPVEGKPPTGDQSWTCFLSAANFKGPIAYYIPETWSKIGKLFDYPFIYGRGLDSRSGRNVTRGVVRRLQEAGFRRIVRKPGAFGVVAYK